MSCWKRRSPPSSISKTRSLLWMPRTSCSAIANWLGLMQRRSLGQLRQGQQDHDAHLERRPHVDPARWHRAYPARAAALLFVRNVGHLMTSPAVLLPDGSETPKGIHGRHRSRLPLRCTISKRLGQFANSRTGSVYIVKPKMHGPEEAAFANGLFAARGRPAGPDAPHDQDRRDGRGAPHYRQPRRLHRGGQGPRSCFINTGFLDRTGDEMHTSMEAGAMVRKGAMKASRLDRRL